MEEGNSEMRSQVLSEPGPGRQKRPGFGAYGPWLVLLAFSVNSAFNAFICMNFTPVAAVTRSVFEVDEAQVAWLYTAFLFAVCSCMPLALFLALRNEALGLGMSVACNVACAWARMLGSQRRSYGLCMISALLSGVGGALFLPMPAQLSQRFLPERWALTTSLAIQANYTGWLLGSVLVPVLVQDADSMQRFLTWQAVISAVVIVLFALFYRPVPPQAALEGSASRSRLSESFREQVSARVQRPSGGTGTASGSQLLPVVPAESPDQGTAGAAPSHSGGDFAGFLASIRDFPSFSLEVLAYGILGGVGFAVPSCNDAILEHRGFSAQFDAVLNAAFIGGGVASGLLLGARCTNPQRYRQVLLVLFAGGSVALSSLAVFVKTLPENNGSAAPAEMALVAVCLLLAGCASIGFVGLGIEAAALYPAGGTYVCFLIELLIQASGAVLNQLGSQAEGYTFMAIAAWLALILLLLAGQSCFRGPH